MLNFVWILIADISTLAPSAASSFSFSSIGASLGQTSSVGLSRALVFIAIFALLLIIVGVIYYIRVSSKKFVPLGWIQNEKQIMQILRGAVRHRSTFELQFPHRGVQRRPILRCSPDEVTPQGLILEATGVKNVARNWTERQVNCYFKINLNGQHIYYAFNSRIKAVEIKRGERCALTVHIPKRLENRQKRGFLRIVPPDEYMLGAALWAGNRVPSPENIAHMGKWLKPSLAYLPGRNEQFYISDISAGGCRILIPRKELLDTGLELGIAQHMLLLIDLLNPDTSQRLRIWLQCRIQNMAAQYDTRRLETGVQFIAWATPGDNLPELEWVQLDSGSEVDILGNWIIRRHLELFRENSEENEPYAV